MSRNCPGWSYYGFVVFLRLLNRELLVSQLLIQGAQTFEHPLCLVQSFVRIQTQALALKKSGAQHTVARAIVRNGNIFLFVNDVFERHGQSRPDRRVAWGLFQLGELLNRQNIGPYKIFHSMCT